LVDSSAKERTDRSRVFRLLDRSRAHAIGPREPGGEWSRHWPLVVSAAFGMSIGSVAIFALGQFIAPMESEFGWGRTQISAVVSLPALMMCLTAGPLGRAIGRHDLRHLAILGTALCAAAIAAFSAVGENYSGWLALWMVYALGAAIAAPTLWVAATAIVFERDRSFAMTVVLCGAGLSSAFVPMLSRALIDASDWRMAFRWLALIWGGTCLALILAFFRDGRRAPLASGAARPAAAEATSLPLRKLIASPIVLQLTIAIFLATTVIAGLMVSLAPLLVDGGMAPTQAANIVGSLGFGVISGKLGSGRLFERLNVMVIVAGVTGSLALACIILDFSGLPAGLVALGCFALGLSSGGLMAIAACLPARLFAPGEFGAVYGWLIGVMGASSIVGPLSAGLAHDLLGSYRVVLWTGVAVAALAAVLLGNVGLRSQKAASA
jgi:predicted MFS family arabinose efflux permease